MTDSASASLFPIVRNETARLANQVWGAGRSVWEADGVTPQTDQLRVARVEAPGGIAQILGSSEVWLRDRRYLVDGRPVMLAASHVPVDLADRTRIAEQDSGPGGVFARLAESGHAPVRFSEDVGAVAAAGQLTARLEVQPGEPLLTSLRTAFDAAGRPVEVSEMVMTASAFRLRFEFPA